MRGLALFAVFVLACGGSRPPTAPVVVPAPIPAPVAPSPPPVAAPPVVETPPAPVEEAVGAVPVPGADGIPPLTIEEVDTTITDADVAAITGWPAAKKSRRAGVVWIAVRADEAQELQLSIIEDDHGVVQHYPIGPATRVTTNQAFDGDTYTARGHGGEYVGPILFAMRVLPPGKATRDQVVVFTSGSTVRIARRQLGAATWKPTLSIAFPAGTTFMGVGTTDPH